MNFLSFKDRYGMSHTINAAHLVRVVPVKASTSTPHEPHKLLYYEVITTDTATLYNKVEIEHEVYAALVSALDRICAKII